MRILIATNHLYDLAGSEMVALEFAGYFLSKGHSVDVFANWAGGDVEPLFSHLGLKIITDPTQIVPMSYDLCYFQHQTAGLFSYAPVSENLTHSLFVFGRLARRSFLESGGWVCDNVLGDYNLANSELTGERLPHTGSSLPVHVFYNAAPPEFDAEPHPLPEQPGRILIVSNHTPPELCEALDVLAAKADIRHMGRTAKNMRRVTPEDIAWADLVISIGKTIQYALVGHKPVYVYDHFGGPGYLTNANYTEVARFSFTGRCCERRLAPAILHEEILSGYALGRDFAQRPHTDWLARFRLTHHLDHLLRLPPSPNAARLGRIRASGGAFEREALMAKHVREQYRTIHSLIAQRR